MPYTCKYSHHHKSERAVQFCHVNTAWNAKADQIIKTPWEATGTKNIWSDLGEFTAFFWPAIRDRIILRDKVCQFNPCYDNINLEVHHIIPRRLGGADHPANLITLCPSCHGSAEKEVIIQSGLAGLAYLLRNLAPLHLMCDRNDIRVQSESGSSLANNRPAIIFHDAVPGGIGLSEKLYDLFNLLFPAALEIIRECRCKNGCPACTGPVAEKGSGSKEIVRKMLSKIIDQSEL